MWGRLTGWLAGALALAALAWPEAARADFGRPGIPGLTVPGQSVLTAAGPSTGDASAPPVLRVVQLPRQLTLPQFDEVVQELQSSTPTSRTIVVAPSFVSMATPPSAASVAQFAASTGPDSAALVLTPAVPSTEATFNAATLLYARIPERLLVGTMTLDPGDGAGGWSLFQSYFPACFSLCASLSDAQRVPYSGLLANGGQRVGSAAALLADLQAEPRAIVTWQRLGPLSPTTFAQLFPSRAVVKRSRRPTSSSGLAPVLIAALVAGLLVVSTGLLLWRRKRRRSQRSRRSAQRRLPLVGPMPPSSGRPPRRSEADPNAFLPVIGAGDVVDAPVRSGFSPDGYVEIDDCLVRATWSDSAPLPPPGQTVIARLVSGAVQATRAGASTPRTER
jgi:hypothetical protein